MFLPFFLKQAELQENLEARGERMGGVQTHKRMVASLEKQISVQEKKLEQVRHIQIFLINIVLFEEFIWRESGFSCFFCVGIHHLLVTVINLNNQIMTPESGIMDGRRQNKVYRLLSFFSLGHFQLALPADFLFRHGARFSKDLESFRARRQILKSQLL